MARKRRERRAVEPSPFNPLLFRRYRLWTAEGTKQVKEEKATEIAKILTKTKEKSDLNQQQEAFIKRKTSTLTRINNPFPRPSKPLSQGQGNI
jgi:hypothetical protein